MPQQDTMQVCLNGHQITDHYYKWPHRRKNFCTTCGEKTTTKCPSCNNDIKGAMIYENVISVSAHSVPVPDICDNCGKDFPWRGKNLTNKVASKSSQQDSVSLVKTICDKFHIVAKQLRQRYNDRETLDIKDEYDVQDLLHSLLRIFFEDVRAEEWNPSYAGSSTRSDFLLKNEKIIIEVKKTRQQLKSKQLGEQLIIDIAHYQKHPDCKTLYCFVYDPDGYIANPKGIENDLSRTEKDFKVIVNIVP